MHTVMTEETIYFQALDMPATEREQFLATACAENEAMRQRLQTMLALPSDAPHPIDLLVNAAPQHLQQLSNRLANSKAPFERVGEYRIIREIGRGGMGVVYEAVQEPLGRQVALKVITDDLTQATRVDRFQREARIASKLHHSHIVPVFDYGTQQHLHYYAMQFIPGLSLDQLQQRLQLARQNSTVEMARQETRTEPGSSTKSNISDLGTWHGASLPRRLAQLMLQAAEALAYAHEQGVMHRDIKPANLLLDENGHIWIADFGLAKLFTGDTLTESGFLVGTQRYLAPERLSDEGDASSDLFSLGATFYELLAGEPAFPATDLPKLMEQLTQQEPRRLNEANPQVPVDLSTIIHKLLAKSPGDRYASAHALACDLQQFLTDRPITARPLWPHQRLVRWARRNSALAASVAFAFFSLLIGCGISLWQWQRAEHRAIEAGTARDLSQRRLKIARDALRRIVAPLDKPSLDPLDDMTPYQVKLLHETVDALEALRQEGETSETSLEQLHRGNAWERRAEALLRREHNPVAAEQAIAKAIEVYRDCDHPFASIYLAGASFTLGDVLLNQGKQANALRLMSASLDEMEKLTVEQGRSDPGHLRNLVKLRCYYVQSMNNRSLSRPVFAVLKSTESLVRKYAEPRHYADTGFVIDWCDALVKLAQQHHQQGDGPACEKYRQEAETLLRRLDTPLQSLINVQRIQAELFSLSAAQAETEKDFTKALIFVDQAVAKYRQILQQTPHSLSCKYSYGSFLGRRPALLYKAGKTQEAWQEFDRLNDFLRKAFQDSEKCTPYVQNEWLMSQAANMTIRANCEVHAGLLQQADQSYQAAHELLVKRKAVPEVACALSGIKHDWASLLQRQGQGEKSHELLLQAIELQLQARKEVPDLPFSASFLANHRLELIRHYLRRKNEIEALAIAWQLTSQSDAEGWYLYQVALECANLYKRTKQMETKKSAKEVLIQLLKQFAKSERADVSFDANAFSVVHDHLQWQTILAECRAR